MANNKFQDTLKFYRRSNQPKIVEEQKKKQEVAEKKAAKRKPKQKQSIKEFYRLKK